MVTFPGGGSRLIDQRGLYTVPTAGRVHTATETRAMMARSVPATQGAKSRSAAEPGADVVGAIAKLQRTIESRKQLPPANITVQGGDDRAIDKTLRSIIRSRY